MKVLCVRLPAPLDGMQLDSSPWVTVDREYPVVAVAADPGNRVQLQLLNDASSLGWFDADCFLTLDDSIPDNWTARIGEGGKFDMAPRAWLEEGFWERYYDADPSAQESVEREVAIILGPAAP